MSCLVPWFATVLLWVAVDSFPDATYHKHLRVGALAQPEGPVLLVEDVVDVKLTVRNLKKLEAHQFPRFRTFIAQTEAALTKTAAQVHTMNDTMLYSLLGTITFRFDHLRYTFSSIQNLSPWTTLLHTPAAHARTKRGLIDIGGRLLSGLFGVATSDDVHPTFPSYFSHFLFLYTLSSFPLLYSFILIYYVSFLSSSFPFLFFFTVSPLPCFHLSSSLSSSSSI